jgi:hypothetical protein
MTIRRESEIDNGKAVVVIDFCYCYFLLKAAAIDLTSQGKPVTRIPGYTKRPRVAAATKQ